MHKRVAVGPLLAWRSRGASLRSDELRPERQAGDLGEGGEAVGWPRQRKMPAQRPWAGSVSGPGACGQCGQSMGSEGRAAGQGPDREGG